MKIANLVFTYSFVLLFDDASALTCRKCTEMLKGNECDAQTFRPTHVTKLSCSGTGPILPYFIPQLNTKSGCFKKSLYARCCGIDYSTKSCYFRDNSKVLAVPFAGASKYFEIPTYCDICD